MRHIGGDIHCIGFTDEFAMMPLTTGLGYGKGERTIL